MLLLCSDDARKRAKAPQRAAKARIDDAAALLRIILDAMVWIDLQVGYQSEGGFFMKKSEDEDEIERSHGSFVPTSEASPLFSKKCPFFPRRVYCFNENVPLCPPAVLHFFASLALEIISIACCLQLDIGI